MAKRTNHYEAAFEEYLRRRQIAYVAVDEKKRALLGDASLKSLDFIVSTPWGQSWLVDVKGRQFPSGGQKQYWKNWSTGDDIRSLTAWQRIFGPSFQGLLVFAYDVLGNQAPLPAEQLFDFRGRLYGFLGVRLGDYAATARPISAKWDTLAMPVRSFRVAAAPIEQFFCQTEPPERSELPEFDDFGVSATAEGLAMAGRW
ncbi:MAG TPA: HYExAFE family protein [Pirellulales bacterium]|jgi:hypothetical protein